MLKASKVDIIETDALHGINIGRIVKRVNDADEIADSLLLKGNPPVGVCTICVGKKEIGWQKHFGVVRPLEGDVFYRGE